MDKISQNLGVTFANSREIFRGGQNHPFQKNTQQYTNTPILAQFILKKEETKIYQGWQL
jgi:hypothetical protein